MLIAFLFFFNWISVYSIIIIIENNKYYLFFLYF